MEVGLTAILITLGSHEVAVDTASEIFIPRGLSRPVPCFAHQVDLNSSAWLLRPYHPSVPPVPGRPWDCLSQASGLQLSQHLRASALTSPTPHVCIF